ncbi:MAG: 4-hydroxy-tetrahydrodipicolinate synthase [Firmicutes bacterium]|nr:4-hydroxy-tetrahydrodipicolinate synthase [Bacillota bacterium]
MDFGRVVTAMVTPMYADGAVNYSQAAHLAEYLFEHGSDAVVVCGTTGESPTLNTEEKLRLLRAVKDAAAGHGIVIAGTSSNDTAASVALSCRAAELGADALLLDTPCYNKPPQEGLYQHYAAIARAVDLPLMLYNVPGRTACNLEAATVARLAQEFPHIAAVKEASGNLEQASRIRDLTPPAFRLYSGNDGDTLPLLALGGSGVVSVASHLVGREIREMVDLCLGGEFGAAAQLHRHLADMFKKLFICANPIPLKYALNRIGMDVGGCRLPLVSLNAAQKQEIDALLDKYNLI